MRADNGLEAGCLSALMNLAAVDMQAAQAALDTSGAQAQDFADLRLRAIWGALEATVRDGRVPDVIALGSRLPEIPRKFLADTLLSDSSVPASERLRALRDLGIRRRCWAALTTLCGVVANTSNNLAAVAVEARKATEALETGAPTIAPLDSEMHALIDHLEEVSAGRREATLETGVPGLDAVIAGLQPTLTVIGALPGVGKSALIAAICRNLSGRNVRVGLFSLEDEKRWLVERMVAEAADIPVFVLANRPLGKQQQERLYAAAPAVHAALRNVVVDDRPALTAADVVASAREMLTRHRVKALLVDHLGELKFQRAERHDLEVWEALKELRGMAKTYRVPVVVACHLKRREGLTEYSTDVRKSDFAFTAAVERMARVALALSLVKDAPDMLRVHVLKQTKGQSGVSVDLEMNRPAAIVANASAPGVRRSMDSRYEAQESSP